MIRFQAYIETAVVVIFVLIVGYVCVAQAEVIESCQTIQASGVVTATGNSGTPIAIGRNQKARKFVVSAAYNSGTTATLDVKIQHCRSNTGTVDCRDVTALIAEQCGTSTCYTAGVKNFDVDDRVLHLQPYVRAVWTLGGSSPNYTIGVEACK